MSKRKQRRQATTAVATQPIPLDTALLFAPPILTGALLLFAVQPLIARYLLPWFGGGPGVWTACMLFFQALLLGGYLYAHLSVKYLGTRGQIVLHVLLLTGALSMIPIVPSAHWKPTGAEDPVWLILLLLGATIGLPYFTLSATSPLLQAWFVKVRPGTSPYRLFALSNLGSLLALISYPTVVEPFLTRRQQAWTWSGGLILFAVMCVACAVHVWRRARTADAGGVQRDEPVDQPSANGRFRLVLWLGLPMAASVLLLAITNTLTEDVASTPLLWVIPLSLYLLTFIIAFDSPRWYLRRLMLVLLPLCMLWVLRLQWVRANASPLEELAGYSTALFILCLFCHGELARRKPAGRYLTQYYLAIAVGGAVGGVLVAVVAPRVFDRLMELPLGIITVAALAMLCVRTDPVRHGMGWVAVFATCAVALPVAVHVVLPLTFEQPEQVIERSRNFYGTLMVVEFDGGGRGRPVDRVRAMNHGNTSHGFQFVAPEKRRLPTFYFRPASGIGHALRFFPRQENRRVGIVGLGVGTLATYGKAGDTYRFYEINPDVEHIARTHFTFLADSAAKTEVVLGDGRLTLEREPSQQFDILILDAFSGDSVPAHLLTAEAFDVYWRHLKPDGIIAAQFTNRTVDLTDVLLSQAQRLGLAAPTIIDADLSWWMLMTRNEAFMAVPEVRNVARLGTAKPGERPWTDDHINLLKIISWLPNTAS